MNWLFKAHSLWWNALLSLEAGEGEAWSCFNGMCQALLTLHEKPYPFCRVDHSGHA